MNRSETIAELAKALSKAQSVMGMAKKSASNPFFKSHYADLASVWEVCQKPLTDNGLSVVQAASVQDTAVSVETMLLHVSGEYLSSVLLLAPKAHDPQSIGSAITYGRRYALAAMVGVASEDDDGEAATEHKTEKAKKPEPKPEPEKVEPPKVQGLKDLTPDQFKNAVVKAGLLLEMIPDYAGKTANDWVKGGGRLDDLLRLIQDKAGEKKEATDGKRS